MFHVIPAQPSVSEAPSRDPDISRAKRVIVGQVSLGAAVLGMGSLSLALMRWIPDLRFASAHLVRNDGFCFKCTPPQKNKEAARWTASPKFPLRRRVP
jgi:hypothetical protein